MNVEIHGWNTDGYPTDDETKEVCKIGQGADCCAWLVMGARGFECTVLHQSQHIQDRLKAGTMTAKRNGCPVMRMLDTVKMGAGSHEVDLSSE